MPNVFQFSISFPTQKYFWNYEFLDCWFSNLITSAESDSLKLIKRKPSASLDSGRRTEEFSAKQRGLPLQHPNEWDTSRLTF